MTTTKILTMIVFIILMVILLGGIIYGETTRSETSQSPKESIAYITQTSDWKQKPGGTYDVSHRYYLKIDDAYEWQNVNYTELKSILIYHHEKYGLDAVNVDSMNHGTSVTPAKFFESTEGWFNEDPGVMQLPISELEHRYYPPPTPTPYSVDYPGLYRQVVGNESQGGS